MRLTTQRFTDWIEAETNNALPFKVGFALGRIPDMPNRAASIIKTSSPRYLNNGLFEEIIYRIQTRGSSNSIEDAEQIALTVDELLDNRTMFDIGDVYILSIATATAPRQINITDPQSRFNFTADYKVIASMD